MIFYYLSSFASAKAEQKQNVYIKKAL